MDRRLDRARGALLGLACGDAVGTTLEFQSPGSFAPIDDMVGGGPFGLEPGQWTDDTSMALCLAESLLDVGGMDQADQMRRYLLWREHGYLSSTGGCFDIGNTVSRQLSRFARTGEPVDPDVDQEAAANGSLMRLAPVPIRWHASVEEAAERSAESSRPTHAAERPVDSCRLTGAMLAALIGGASWDEVTDADFWSFGPLHREVAALARGAWRGKEPPDVRGTGYCIDALQAALWAVDGADDVRAAVLRAANLGDDADTTAAIAGQLAGARWGAADIPPEWLDRLVLHDRIVALASGLFQAGDRAGTEAVGAEPEAWPHDVEHHAWWVEPSRVLAGEYPGEPQHPGKAAANIGLLVDVGVRTFVDLTEEGELTPYDDHVAAAAEARGLDLRHVRIPIRDFSVAGVDTYDRILATIAAESARGVVYVHCWGGIGRTGTVVGCLLVDGGLDGRAALDRIATLRAGSRKQHMASPQTPEQIQIILDRALSRGGGAG